MYARTTPRRRSTTTALAVAALALTAACGSGTETTAGGTAAGTSPSASTSAFNPADVAFATGMIPHHAQALEMAEMARTSATDAEVKALAVEIEKAQDPEITTMTGWLKEWNAPVPSTGPGHSGSAGGHSGMGTGMMTADQMDTLDATTGPAFDRRWLERMTEHHEGAVEMARTELRDGQDPRAKALAEQIRAAQTAEIATMAGISQRLG